MTATPGADLTHAAWPARRARAATLRAQRPHAATLLDSYLGVLDLQEPLYDASRDGRWPDLRNATVDTVPMFTLDRLPYESLATAFGEFVRDVGPVMPDTLAPAATTLDSAGAGLRADLLRDAASRRPLGAHAERLRTDVTPLEFFSRAFLQPLAEAQAHRHARSVERQPGASCPFCGWPAQLALLQDAADVQGRRSLVCALCSLEWTFARSVCVNCGEADAERLAYHVDEGLPHLKIEACASCRSYLKVVDLRAHGTLAPVVDELASVELDLWCDEQGLVKLQPNLFDL